MFQEIPPWLQGFAAFCGLVGTLTGCLNSFWAYRIKMAQIKTELEVAKLHDCLDQHIEESRNLHVATLEAVKTVAATDDLRDTRNEARTGANTPILSGEHTNDGQPKP